MFTGIKRALLRLRHGVLALYYGTITPGKFLRILFRRINVFRNFFAGKSVILDDVNASALSVSAARNVISNSAYRGGGLAFLHVR